LPYDHETKILLFFHGNAEDIGIAYEILNEVRSALKIAVLAVEYPGYGLYNSNINADIILDDALHVYDHITKHLGVDESDVILFGRSIGSSPACYVAKNRSPGGMLLMSPFKSLKEVARDLVGWFLGSFIAERFRNIDLIKEIQCPVFIVHGQKDKLIPYHHSQDLHDSCMQS
jgi:pimeloyl-ACP methyl ester carboxylesterase